MYILFNKQISKYVYMYICIYIYIYMYKQELLEKKESIQHTVTLNRAMKADFKDGRPEMISYYNIVQFTTLS